MVEAGWLGYTLSNKAKLLMLELKPWAERPLDLILAKTVKPDPQKTFRICPLPEMVAPLGTDRDETLFPAESSKSRPAPRSEPGTPSEAAYCASTDAAKRLAHW